MNRLLLTDRQLQMVSKADRKELGLRTSDEISASAEIKSERELHKQLGNVLRSRGIEFFESRMDKRTGRPKGEPDFVFSVIFTRKRQDEHLKLVQEWPCPCGWEAKLPGKELDPDQVAMFKRLTTPPNFWYVTVIHSVDEALAELRKFGL